MNIGARAIERDYSHYVSYVANTVLAVVGTATKGPVGVPTLCTSTQDLVNKFGTLNTKCPALYAGQYFLSQSSKLYFVRAAGSGAAGSKAIIKGSGAGDSSVSDALTVQFLEVGTHYDGYSLTVSEGTSISEGTKTYDISIKSAVGVEIESIKGITLADLTKSVTVTTPDDPGTTGVDESEETTVYTYQSKVLKVVGVNSSATSLSTGTYKFTGGNDGFDTPDYAGVASTLLAESVDFNLLAVPGVSESGVITAYLQVAETRGDCIYLIDPPENLDRDGVISWRESEGEFKSPIGSTSYGALYYDWVTIYDSVNKLKVSVPPSVVVAPTIAYSDRIAEIWYAPAGLSRGIVRGVLESNTKLSKADADALYEHGINSIYDDPQVGLVLWGQKTLLSSDTALNRINVRRLLNYLKKVVTAACDYMTFEPNDRITWNSFRMKINPILQGIQAKRGVYEYRIVKGETIVSDTDIDNYRMPAMIMIRPTKAAEEIPIYFTLTSTGADFNEVLETNGVISNE